jgi:hypothetical protein
LVAAKAVESVTAVWFTPGHPMACSRAKAGAFSNYFENKLWDKSGGFVISGK